MSFSIDEFATTPRLETLSSLKKMELMTLVTHYKSDIPTGACKADIRKTIVSYLVEEELVSDDDDKGTTDIEL